MNSYLTHSQMETTTLAKKLARRLKGGDILLLEGELGAGKTTFVRGLAQALGIKERITSPTFVLMHIHENIKTLKHKNIAFLVHCDAYRVKSASELKDAGLMDWLNRPDTITIVEWGEKIKPLLRGRPFTILQFQHGKKENERTIQLH